MEQLGRLSRAWTRAAFAACAAWLLLYELRVIVAPGLDAGPLTSRFAHDVVLLVASALILLKALSAGRERLAWLLIGLGVLAWAVLIRLTAFPAIATQRDVEEDVGALDDFRALLRDPRVLLGVLAQFFYVGAQVGVWSFLIRYAEVAVPGTPERVAAGYLTISLVTFMAGRFVGSALMGVIRAPSMLAIFAVAGALLCLFATIVGGMSGIVALIASSFFMSIMYPTIFAETVDGLGARTKSAAALLVMAIVGGAVFPAVMGLVSDRTGSMVNAMAVPACCFLVVLGFALTRRKTA